MNLGKIQITCDCGCETLRLLKVVGTHRTDENILFASAVLVCTNCCEQHDVHIEENKDHIEIKGSKLTFKEVR